jgi:hypothetical protein
MNFVRVRCLSCRELVFRGTAGTAHARAAALDAALRHLVLGHVVTAENDA